MHPAVCLRASWSSTSGTTGPRWHVLHANPRHRGSAMTALPVRNVVSDSLVAQPLDHRLATAVAYRVLAAPPGKIAHVDIA